MSEFVSEQQSSGESEPSDRREFLSRSGVMLALLALVQGGDVAEAAASSRYMQKVVGPAAIQAGELQDLKLTLNSAITSGRVDPKSAEFQKVSPALQKALLSLNASDLQTLSRAQAILNGHFNFRSIAADNNGTIGM